MKLTFNQLLKDHSKEFKQEFLNLLKKPESRSKYANLSHPSQWHQDSINFFSYLYDSSFNGHTLFVPIPATIRGKPFRRKHFRNAEIMQLFFSGYIQCDPPYAVPGLERPTLQQLNRLKMSKQAYAYAIRPEIRDQLYELRLQETLPTLEHRNYWEKINKSGKKTSGAESDTILKSFKHLEWGMADVESVKRILDELRSKKRTYKNMLQLHQIYNTLFYLKRQNFDPQTLQYDLAYESCSTGRIFGRKGGLQGVKRELKHALYSKLPDVKNYDLKSCHVSILVQEMGKAGLRHNNLSKYLDTKDAKHEYAGMIGVESDCWKQVLYMVFFGGTLHYQPGFAFYEIINDHIPTENKREQVVESFKNSKELDQMIDELNVYRNYAFEKYTNPPESYPARNGLYFKNRCGKSFQIDKTVNKRILKNKLCAHVLQGIESNYIHKLTSLSGKYGFKVISNEHDGIITYGEVCEEAKAEARKLSAFEIAELIPKDYV